MQGPFLHKASKSLNYSWFSHFFQWLVILEGRKLEFILQALSLYCCNGNIALVIIALLIILTDLFNPLKKNII